MSLYRHEIMEKLDAVHPVICVKVIRVALVWEQVVGFLNNPKVGGSIPTSSSLHVRVPRGKIPNPKLLWVHPSECECVLDCHKALKRHRIKSCRNSWTTLVVESSLSALEQKSTVKVPLFFVNSTFRNIHFLGIHMNIQLHLHLHLLYSSGFHWKSKPEHLSLKCPISLQRQSAESRNRWIQFPFL